MTVLGALVRSGLSNPDQPLTSASLVAALGGTKSLAGVDVSESRVMGLTAWYRAVALIAGTAAGLPLKVYDSTTRERVAMRTLLDNPNPTQTPFELWQTLYAHALTWGNAYALKRRDGSGIVSEVWPIHPSRVRVNALGSSKLFDIQNPNGQWVTDMTSFDVFHMPYLSTTGGVGVSPLSASRQMLGTAIAAEDAAGTFYANGHRLSGVLQTDATLTQDQAEALQSRWRTRTAGVENVGKVVVLDSGAKFEPMTIPPADAELLATRQFTPTEIARLFGIPPHMLGDVSGSTSWGSGIEQQTIGFVQFTLQPWLKLVEQRITWDLLPGGWGKAGRYAEYSLEGLLRGDSQSRATFYHQGITDGWLSRNEVRTKENLQPVDGGDEMLVPSNLTLVSVDGNYVPLSAKGMA